MNMHKWYQKVEKHATWLRAVKTRSENGSVVVAVVVTARSRRRETTLWAGAGGGIATLRTRSRRSIGARRRALSPGWLLDRSSSATLWRHRTIHTTVGLRHFPALSGRLQSWWYTRSWGCSAGSWWVRHTASLRHGRRASPQDIGYLRWLIVTGVGVVVTRYFRCCASFYRRELIFGTCGRTPAIVRTELLVGAVGLRLRHASRIIGKRRNQ
jgi:hypothetical protein